MIDRIIQWIGEKAAWHNLALIAIIGLDVLFRYGLDSTQNWILELEWHLFALIFLLGTSYALQKDEHVRVDVLYQSWSPKTQAWVNLLGHLFLLLPWCAMIIITGYHYASNSFSFQEGSPNPGGLPYRYIIKSFIFLSFSLVLLQGLSQIVGYIRVIKSS